jgi:hypothetical protein
LKRKYCQSFKRKTNHPFHKAEYLKDADKNAQALPPLLYAGILLEGGVISYDSNIMTGGLVRYFESELLHSTDRTGLPFIFVLFPH